jgi:hypothetical protein
MLYYTHSCIQLWAEHPPSWGVGLGMGGPHAQSHTPTWAGQVSNPGPIFAKRRRANSLATLHIQVKL